MNAMFKEIRQGDIEKVKARIEKNPDVVNEVFTGKKPLKDIGQSPLQVAVKCGQFEIIDLLLEKGADPDFMENRADQPMDTEHYYFAPMPVLEDAIKGVFGALAYHNNERSKQYIKVVEKLLIKGADPNKESYPNPRWGTMMRPLGVAVCQAEMVISEDRAKEHLFEVLDLLKQYGADFDLWLDSNFFSVYAAKTYRAAFLDDFIPQEDKTYEYEYRGKMYKGITKGDVDIHKEMRLIFREYFKQK